MLIYNNAMFLILLLLCNVNHILKLHLTKYLHKMFLITEGPHRCSV